MNCTVLYMGTESQSHIFKDYDLFIIIYYGIIYIYGSTFANVSNPRNSILMYY